MNQSFSFRGGLKKMSANIDRYMILNSIKDHAYTTIKEFEEDSDGLRFNESEISQAMGFVDAMLDDFFLTEDEISTQNANVMLAGLLRCLTSMSGLLGLQFTINTRLMGMLKKKDE